MVSAERRNVALARRFFSAYPAPTMSAYWKEVRARARVDLDWYTCSKHYGVWFLKVRLGLPDAVIAAMK